MDTEFIQVLNKSPKVQEEKYPTASKIERQAKISAQKEKGEFS